MQRSALCRSRRELSNAYFLAKFRFDTAENEPCKVCPLSVYSFPRSVLAGAGESSLISGKHHVDQELERRVALVDTTGAKARAPPQVVGCCTARDRANLTGLVLGCIEAKFCK